MTHDPPLRVPSTTGAGLRDASAVDWYYEHISEPDTMRKAGNARGALQLAMSMLDLVSPLIRETKRQYGTFDLHSIPPLECACVLAAIRQDHDALRTIRALIEREPDLAPWTDVIDHAESDAVVVRHIRHHLATNPGSLQSHLGKQLGDDGNNIGRLVRYLVEDGQLRREPAGRTYALYLQTDDRAD